MKLYKTGLIFIVSIFMFSCWGLYIPNEEEIEFEVICHIYPDLGTPGTEFTFNIDAIKIKRDSITHLTRHKFRWDFNNDGTFDTEWSNNIEENHTFNTEGNHQTIIEVKTPGLDIHRDTCRVLVQPLIKIYDNISGHDIGSVDCSIDGSNRIAFDRPSNIVEGEIWTIDYPNNNPKQVSSDNALFPEWSSDGKYILFRRGQEFWVVDLETGEEQALIVWGGIISFVPSWSHNIRNLAYTTKNSIEIYSLNVGNVTRIPTDVTYNLISWSPDDQILAVASRNNELSTLDFFDVEESKLSASISFEFNYTGAKLDWSLDNKWLSTGFANNSSVLYILNRQSGEFKQIEINGLENVWYAGWSYDSKMIVFAGSAPSENTSIWGIQVPEDF